MRIIPKKIRVTTTWIKGVTLQDILVAFVAILLISLFVTSNLPNKFVFTGGLAVVCFILFIKFTEDDRLYATIAKALRYFARKRVFVNTKTQQLFPVESITGGVIDFGDYYAKVFEILPLEFRLLNETKQDRVIEAFANTFRMLSSGQVAQFVKIDRPIIYDKFIARLDEKIKAIENVEFKTEDERIARTKILELRKQKLKQLNSTEREEMCCYYVVIYSMSKSELNNLAFDAVSKLAQAEVECEILDDEQLKIFYKYNFYSADNFDERKLPSDSELKSFLTPKTVEFSPTKVTIDGSEISQFAITDYPIQVSNAWGYEIMNIPGTRVVMNIAPIDHDKAVKIIDKAVLEVSAEALKGGKASEQLEQDIHISTLSNTLSLVKAEKEVLCDVSLYVTLAENNYAGTTKEEVQKKLRGAGFAFSKCTFSQFEAFVSSNLTKRNLYKPAERSIHSSSIAACFPCVLPRFLEANGVLIGINNSSAVVVDFFKRSKVYQNSNTICIGSSGSGKSYGMKNIICNLLSENVKAYIFDPENEFKKLCGGLDGKYINVSAGNIKINPFHIYLGNGDEDDNLCFLEEHLQFLTAFYQIVLPELTPLARELLNKLTAQLYAKFNIFTTTPEEVIANKKPGDYPIFDDLYSLVKQYLDETVKAGDMFTVAILRELELYCQSLATGGRYSNLWNGASVLEAEENLIVFNFQQLLKNNNSITAQVQMLLITRYVNNEAIKHYNLNKALPEDKMQRFMVVFDEAHYFISEKNTIAVEFMHNNAKRLRKYGGMQVITTQSIHDFIKTDALKSKAIAMLAEAQYTMIYKLNGPNMQDVVELYRNYDINEVEQGDIVEAERGNVYFISSSTNRTSFLIIANEEIQKIFDDKAA